MSSDKSAAPRELLRSKHPRANGVVCLIFAIVLAVGSGIGFWLSAAAVAVVGPAVAALVLALLSVLIAILAFQLPRRASTALSLLGPLRFFGILVFAVGAAGAACGLALGGITGSLLAVGAGLGVLIISIVVAAQAAAVYGAATARG